MAGLTGLDLGSRSFKAVGVNMVKDGYTLAGIGYRTSRSPKRTRRRNSSCSRISSGSSRRAASK